MSGSPPHVGGYKLVTSLAFSLVEILVVVGLLSVIILGLMLMFNQTQKAFRLGMAQVDVQEGGRTVTEMIARELLQITPTGQSRFNNVINFYVILPNYSPLTQSLPGGGSVARTNLLEELYFMKRENQTWFATGYFVRTSDGSGNLSFPGTVGTLYRFETNYSAMQFSQTPDAFIRDYKTARLNESRASRVVDGVVHFKVRTYDMNGVWQTQDLPNNYNFNKSDIRLSGPSVAPGEVGLYTYYSNAVPAFVEFELGILEARVAARAKAIPDATARRQYLTDQASRVHIFRMRVPIRNVDPLAYQ